MARDGRAADREHEASSARDARPLRGRRAELAAIASMFDRAAAGQPSSVALVGEPGIGKSRLAVEAAAIAAQRGFAARWGRAWEAGGAPPYWPWRQLCDGTRRDGPIAQLWGGRPACADDPSQARFELFDAVTRVLAGWAGEQPMLCILDDLHAADVPSLELVAFATRHLRACRLAWLLAWRDAEASRGPVREQLARVSREAAVVPLTALSEVEANELIDDVRVDTNIELRGRLVRTTGGNPLFLLETLATLAVGRAVGDDQPLPLAQGISSLVNDRLAVVSEPARTLAEAASVVGRDVTLTYWAAAGNCDAESVRREASALVGAGVLLACGPDRWRFGHDLVREAIYRTAGERARELHHRLATSFDRDVIAGDSSLVGERAHHGLCAMTDVRTVLDWTIAAADHARGQCAYEEALAVIDRAITRIGPAAQRDPALQLARGRALLDLGETEAAREVLFATISLARKVDDPRLAAAATLAFGARYVLGDHPHDLVALIDEALASLPETEHDLHARLLARKAAALTPASDVAAALEIARAANRRVASSADDAARLEVAVAVGSAFADSVHPRERAPINDTVVRLARACGDRALELRGLSRLVTDHVQAGDLASAITVLTTRDALARALGQPRFLWMEPLFRSMLAMVRGDFAVCDAAVAEAETLAHHDPNGVRVCAVHRLWLALYADRVDDLAAHEPVVLDAIRSMRTFDGLIRAAVRLRTQELAQARREVDALDPSLPHVQAITCLTTLGEIVAEVGVESRQRDVYARLAPFADTYAGWGLFALVAGPPVAATLGHLAGAFGDLERARAHFESALAMTTAIDARVGRAWTGYWYGRTLARHGDGDAERVLGDAAGDASRLGMIRLVERCHAALERAPAASGPVPRAPAAALVWTIVEHAGAWRVGIGDRSFLVPNLRGMAMLARLAAAPHVEIHSRELVSGSAGRNVDLGDAGELLDDKARAAYRTRIARLAEEIEAAEARGDAVRAERASQEHEALLKELSRAVGLGGRVRRAGAAEERARVSAQRRLREAIRKIGELDAELGSHLESAVRTGMFCAYRP